MTEPSTNATADDESHDGASEPSDEPSSRLRPRRVDLPSHGTRLAAVEIHDNILAAGSEDSKRPTVSLLWSSLASGLAIGFSFLGSAFLSTLAEGESAKKALVALGYPLGFFFVVIGRMELFTENTLEPVIPLLHGRTWGHARALFRLWAVLLLGNLAGALVFAALLARTPVVPDWLHHALGPVALESTSGGWTIAFYRGIYAGWVIALMSWLLGTTTSRGAQIVIIWACAAVINAFGFRHSIAGAVEAFYRAWDGSSSFATMFFGFILPAVLGNAVGGVVLVAVLNYAQVKRELPPNPVTR